MIEAAQETRKKSLADLLADTSFGKSALGQFLGYQLAPERFLAPNQRLQPGSMEGYQYSPQPDEHINDAGEVYGPGGIKREFVEPPALASLLDLIGYKTGGIIGGAEKGALGAGAFRRLREVQPALKAGDVEATRDLAMRLEAGAKRTLPEGYKAPSTADDKALAKMDKALTKMSGEPSANAMQRAERALEMGLDTPAFHITSGLPEKEMAKYGTPFREMNPFIKDRGAMYLGDEPSKILKSGAAQSSYDPRVYAFTVGGDIFGHTPMPSNAYMTLPEVVAGADKWGNVNPQSLAEIIEGMRSIPGYGDDMKAVMEHAKEYYSQKGNWGSWNGSNFSPSQHNASIAGAENSVAKKILDLYYNPNPESVTGMKLLGDPMNYKSAGVFDPGLPGWQGFEHGAMPNLPGKMDSGLYSPIQNVMRSMGFAGSRVIDETKNAGGKTFGMMDPVGIRSASAKFKDPYGDLLSADVPVGWVDQMFPRQMPAEAGGAYPPVPETAPLDISDVWTPKPGVTETQATDAMFPNGQRPSENVEIRPMPFGIPIDDQVKSNWIKDDTVDYLAATYDGVMPGVSVEPQSFVTNPYENLDKRPPHDWRKAALYPDITEDLYRRGPR